MIKVIYNKVCGRCVQSEPLTSGMVGQTIHFEYSHDFDGLTLTAVFTNGKTTVDVLNPGNQCVIPHEVLDTVGEVVKVGVYAVRGNELVIPTIYANIGTVLNGADPSGDVSADPTLPVWAQTQALIGNLNELTTEAKNNLVAAINEAAQSGGGSTIELDTTLSEAGKAADAKAVGDALAGKQNTISDLEAIRTGAAKGTTALQSVPNTYRTASEQDTIDSGKVDKVTGKGLSTNDYTDAAKAKVDALAPVAISGSYNDLTDKPTIPTALPNPNSLTFTGAVTGSYDGSAPLTVNIPQGGGGSGGGYSDYEVLIDETITTDEAGISIIRYTELVFSKYNDIVIYFDRAINKAYSGQNLKVSIRMLGYIILFNHSVANPVDSYRSSFFRVLNMGNGNVASFASTASNQHNNPSQLYCCGIFPLNAPYSAAHDNGFDLEFSEAYIGTIKLKILAK